MASMRGFFSAGFAVCSLSLLCFFLLPRRAAGNVAHIQYETSLEGIQRVVNQDSMAQILVLSTSPTFSLTKDKPRYPNSNIAMLCSALVPGGGQIYNRKYWKLPIVWGAAAACTYAIIWNHQTYSEYEQAFKDYTGADPLSHTSWQSYLPFNAKPEENLNNAQLKDRLRRGMDAYRRQRDFSIIISCAVYLLNILDAYVDAELYRFDISPDLSMQVQPFSASPTGGLQYGLACRFHF